MPSDRFLKLKEEKQDRIIEASVDEFTSAGYAEASINKIIKDADISRGSFYTYFEDKSDLFGFIFNRLKVSAYNSIIKAVQDNKGNVFDAARQMMTTALHFRLPGNDRMMRLYDKIISDFNIIEHLNGLQCPNRDNIDMMAGMLDEIYEQMDDLKEHISRENFGIIADMLITLSVRTLVMAKKMPDIKEYLMNSLFYQYDIIEKGIRGEEK